MRNKTYYLYKFSDLQEMREQADLHMMRLNGFKVKIKNEKLTKTELIGRLLFKLQTFGKAEVWYVSKNEEILHKSLCVPYCKKFSFMKKGDFEIGPCVTNPLFRGQGIYPRVLSSIVKEHLKEKDSDFYMLVHQENKSSIKGIEKAGFKRIGVVEQYGLFKWYRRIS